MYKFIVSEAALIDLLQRMKSDDVIESIETEEKKTEARINAPEGKSYCELFNFLACVEKEISIR